MKKIKYLAFALVVFYPIFSHAGVYINEIYYSPKTSSWIEIYNDSDTSVDITQYKIADAGATVNGHGITSVSGVNPVPANSYAVIATTNAVTNFISSSFSLFKSALAANTNPGDTIIIRSGSNVIDSVSFANTQGANGDGNSLQKNGSTWISAIPTPGLVNATEAHTATDTNATTTDTTNVTQTNTTNDTSSSSTSAHTSYVPLSNTDQKMEFQISAGRDRLTSVGNRVVFLVVPTVIKNITASSISYIWSFGDGTTGQGTNVTHIYKFAGEYSVVVNASFSDIQAVSRLTVKVINPKILLSSVLGGIGVTNNSGAEINLEGWNLIGQTKTFIFPKDTLIPDGKEIIFANDVTGINFSDISIKNTEGTKYAEIIGSTNSSVLIASTTVDTNDIAEKIKDVTKKVVFLSSQMKEIADSNVLTLIENSVVNVPEKIISSTDIIETKNDNKIQTANALTIFEAPESRGFVSTVFTWPIKGFNFVRNLFIEK